MKKFTKWLIDPIRIPVDPVMRSIEITGPSPLFHISVLAVIGAILYNLFSK